MVQILPFCGWRYDLSQVGALSEVTAPSVELIDEAIQNTLYRQHPCNAVRLVMNREEPGDSSPRERTARADDFFRLWKREGILLREHETAFYIVETTYQSEGTERIRWSITVRLRLPELFPRISNGLVSVAQSDSDSIRQRKELRKTCHASLQPVIALLQDTTGADSDPRSLSDHLESIVRSLPPIECIGDDGIRHRMWPLTNQTAKTELEARLSHFSVCIIGGAVEVAAAVQLRDELLAAGQLTDPNDPAHTVLACLVSTDDRGLELLPRVLAVKRTQSLTGEQAMRLLSAELYCQFVGAEPSACADAAELARLNDQQPCLAIGTDDRAWMIVNAGNSDGVESIASLVDRIEVLTSAGSADACNIDGQRLPSNYTGLKDSVSAIRQSAQRDLIIIEPPVLPSELFWLASGSIMLPKDALRLYPDVPTGMVFSSLDF